MTVFFEINTPDGYYMTIEVPYEDAAEMLTILEEDYPESHIN